MFCFYCKYLNTISTNVHKVLLADNVTYYCENSFHFIDPPERSQGSSVVYKPLVSIVAQAIEGLTLIELGAGEISQWGTLFATQTCGVPEFRSPAPT